VVGGPRRADVEETAGRRRDPGDLSCHLDAPRG
jgi:hypothetical protein